MEVMFSIAVFGFFFWLAVVLVSWCIGLIASSISDFIYYSVHRNDDEK